MMDSETLEALRGSIQKWEKIVEGTGVDEGTKNCPLCMKFYSLDGDGTRCYGCPVREASGHPYCEETPYVNYTNVYDDLNYAIDNAHSDTRIAACKVEYTEAAQQELDFLRSLLPEGEK